MNRHVFVLAPWGSGSSALCGALEALGAHVPGPRWRTSDPRTPDSFENLALRAVLLRHIDERPLPRVFGDRAALVADLRALREKLEAEAPEGAPIVLKHALGCLVVPEIEAAFSPAFLLLTRPFGEIEASRARRNWPPAYGAEGAKLAYGGAITGLIQAGRSFCSVSYGELLGRPRETLAFAAAGLGLSPTSAQLDAAVARVRPRP